MGGRKDGAREGCEVVAPTPSTRVVDGVTETAESLVPVVVGGAGGGRNYSLQLLWEVSRTPW